MQVCQQNFEGIVPINSQHHFPIVHGRIQSDQVAESITLKMKNHENCGEQSAEICSQHLLFREDFFNRLVYMDISGQGSWYAAVPRKPHVVKLNLIIHFIKN